jgi:repressor LexA
MERKLTAKQEQILEFLKDCILRKGYPPAVREICEAVNLKSTSSVHSHLETLEKKGFIRRDPTKPRAIEICDDSFQMVRTEMVSIPVVGQVAAGTPILAEQNIVDEMPLPSRFVGSGNNFILTVHGDSMVNIGINDGDYLIVQEAHDASNGEIVVAMVNDGFESGATVKRFYKESGHIRLQPENDYMEPIIAEDVTVVGKVKGVFRYFN